MSQFYPADLSVDLDALVANSRRMRQIADGAELLAVVKANGYGFGRNEAALALWQDGVRWFGVSRLPEALALRSRFTAEGIGSEDARILTWLNLPEGAWTQALDAGLDVSVSTPGQLRQVVEAVGELRSQGVAQEAARIHLKMDVGMGRGGAGDADLRSLASMVRAEVEAGTVNLVGFWSHLSYADDPDGPGDAVTAEQIARFETGRAIIEEEGLRPALSHLAATGGTLWYPSARMDMVRVGIGLYGYSPSPDYASSVELGLVPVGKFRTAISQVKRLRAGDTVSYGATWIASADTWVGLLPIGYADGIPRLLSNNAQFVVEHGGQRTRASVLGRVCMDQVVIDLGGGEEPSATVGDQVILFGDPTKDEPAVETWAQAAQTINYEVVARLPEHLDRSYHRSGRP